MVATSVARVSSTLTLIRSRKVAPASSRMRLMLRTTKPNCASKLSGSPPLSSKPGMPETNSKSPVRAANDSGGDLIPAGGAKCFVGGMGGSLTGLAACEYTLPIPPMGYNPRKRDSPCTVAPFHKNPPGDRTHEDVIRRSCCSRRAHGLRRRLAVLCLYRRRRQRIADDLQGGLDHRRLRRQRRAEFPRPQLR